MSVVPASNDAAGSLHQSTREISRSYAGGEPTPSEMRSASEAYRTEAAARDQAAQQRQEGGVRSADVLA